VVLPNNGPSQNLPPVIGAAEYQLKPKTKSDLTVAADIVIAFETLSGLSLGKWVTCLLKFKSFNGKSLFSMAKTPKWDSHYTFNSTLPSQFWKGCIWKANCLPWRLFLTKWEIAYMIRSPPCTPGTREIA
jgi:hypothetical protein